MHGLEFYAIGKLIGKGAFGKVNIGVHRLTEELTAMKLCERKRIAEVQAKKCLMQEVSILKKLNGSPNIIQLFEVIESSVHIVLVMEFAAGGDLLRHVRQRRRLAEECAQELFKQLLDGLSHIHRCGVVHRDIKLENLLLDSLGCLKIADFGVAVVVKPAGRRLMEHCGTPSYIAPEILLEQGYEGPPVDVWSSGVVLYAMLCGRVPFKGENLVELKRSILRGRFHAASHLTAGSSAMLRALLVVEPKKRATLQESLANPWLEGIGNRASTMFASPNASVPCDSDQQATDNESILGSVVAHGFPREHVDESLREGRLNHATATYHLLSQQLAKKRVATQQPSALDVPALDPN